MGWCDPYCSFARSVFEFGRKTWREELAPDSVTNLVICTYERIKPLLEVGPVSIGLTFTRFVNDDLCHRIRLWWGLHEEIELRSMHLKAVDLLMMEGMRADDELRAVELSSRGAQARVGRERPVLGEPGADGAFRDLAVETPAHELLGFRQRMAEIERRDGFEDEPERIGFILAWLAGEAMQAFGAAVDLQCLQAISAFAFLCGVLAAALRTGGVWLFGGGS